VGLGLDVLRVVRGEVHTLAFCIFKMVMVMRDRVSW
jgi:hypothetical protein